MGESEEEKIREIIDRLEEQVKNEKAEKEIQRQIKESLERGEDFFENPSKNE